MAAPEIAKQELVKTQAEGSMQPSDSGPVVDVRAQLADTVVEQTQLPASDEDTLPGSPMRLGLANADANTENNPSACGNPADAETDADAEADLAGKEEKDEGTQGGNTEQETPGKPMAHVTTELNITEGKPEAAVHQSKKGRKRKAPIDEAIGQKKTKATKGGANAAAERSKKGHKRSTPADKRKTKKTLQKADRRVKTDGNTVTKDANAGEDTRNKKKLNKKKVITFRELQKMKNPWRTLRPSSILQRTQLPDVPSASKSLTTLAGLGPL